jgi:uncharacterized damage-inducible protein DinB
MSRLQLDIEQISFARNYTIRLLDNIKQEDWYRMPAGGITHVAWQVGHLAMAEYRLAVERLRGARSQDANLISQDFLKLVAKDSVPDPNPAKYPSPAAIRNILDRGHEQTLLELPNFDDAELDQAVLKPHSLSKTKFSALLWCANHEMLHAGQIGLLKRLLGYSPVW